ncbi:MAG: acyl carrier protein [Lachnospiraceae bacterium]|nr:acyl carrier protein [Lachnospiraceae bacterium]
MAELEILKQAIQKTLQVYDKEILPEASFETTLGADSIDMAQILKLAEAGLDRPLPAKEWMELKTVGEALALMERVNSGE